MKSKYSGVRPHGNGIQIEIRVGGKRLRPTIKMAPTPKNLRDAVSIRESIRRDIALGNLDIHEYFSDSKILKRFGSVLSAGATLSDALDWWFESETLELDEDTRDGYSKHISNHINPGLGEIILSQVTVADIKKWRDNLNRSAKTKNNICIPLRKTFEYAFAEGLIQQNPMERVKNLKVPKKEADPLLPEEIDAVLSVMEGLPLHHYEFSIWTGLSTAERIGLKWEDVDLDAKVIHVRRTIVKGKTKSTKNTTRWRTVDLFQPAIDALTQAYEITKHQEWVFLNPLNMKVWSDLALSKVWKKALEEAGVRYRTQNKARHTFASIMLSAGVDMGWLRNQMGHEDFTMIQNVYGRFIRSTGPEMNKHVREWVIESCKGGHIPASVGHVFGR